MVAFAGDFILSLDPVLSCYAGLNLVMRLDCDAL